MGQGRPTSRNQFRARRGPSIREFLRYYVFSLPKRDRLTEEGIIERIKEESAGNRDYRPSGQLLVDKQELRQVLQDLVRGNLINSAGAKWRLTRQGRERLGMYEKQKEEHPESKDGAAKVLLKWMGSSEHGGTVLDLGTGEGCLAFKIVQKGYKVLGIDSGSFDYSKETIKTARQKAQSQGGRVEFLQRSVTSLQGRDESFDYVVTSQAIHCMKDELRCVKAIHRLLKPGGTFLCTDFLVGLKGFLRHGWHSFLAMSQEEWQELLPRYGFEQLHFARADDYLILAARKPPSANTGSP